MPQTGIEPGPPDWILGSRPTRRSRPSPALPDCAGATYPHYQHHTQTKEHPLARTWCDVMTAIITSISDRVEHKAYCKSNRATTRPQPPSTADGTDDEGTRIVLFVVTPLRSAMALAQVSTETRGGLSIGDGGLPLGL